MADADQITLSGSESESESKSTHVNSSKRKILPKRTNLSDANFDRLVFFLNKTVNLREIGRLNSPSKTN
jgi:hypothetical protein